MRCVFLFLLFLVAITPNVQAQEITSEPICFVVRNTAEFKVYGSFITDYYTREDGIRARHTSNFRLEPKGTKHEEKGYPLDVAEFCSYGPFFPGRKLDMVLRTLVPIFECRTSVELGEIVIKGRRKADDSGVETWAECL
tara:strand:- start:1588 stop:2004 length:417 start_codon:yes stop_codon:yes gene_type:complete